MKNSLNREGIRDFCLSELTRQLDLFGLEMMEEADIAFVYCHSLGKKKKTIWDLLKNDRRVEVILIAALNIIFNKIQNREKKSDVRLTEIEDFAEKENLTIVLGQLGFIKKMLKRL